MVSPAFSVTFDGQLTQDHSIPVSVMLESLAAFEGAIQAAEDSVGSRSPVTLRLRGSEPGSFVALLELARDAVPQVAAAYAGSIVDPEQLLATVVQAITLLKQLGGKSPDASISDGRRVIMSIGGDSIDVPREVAMVAESLEFRKSTRTALGPLKHSAVTTMKIAIKGAAGPPPAIVTCDEVERFDEPMAPDQLVNEMEHVQVLTLVSPNFREKNKWKFSDGSSDIWATIQDNTFTRNVQNMSVQFAQNDMLKCRVKAEQWSTSRGLRTEYTIVEVLDHIKAMKQMRLL